MVIDLRDDGECDIEPAEAEIAASKSAGERYCLSSLSRILH